MRALPLRSCLIFLPIFIILLLGVNNHIYSQEENKPEYAPGEILVKFKEGIDPTQALNSSGLDIKDINRVHSIKPAIAKFRKNYKLEKDPKSGWYSFLGKKYKDIADIPDEEMFKEAYKNMPEVQKSLYRSYKIMLPEGMGVEETAAKLKNNPNVEYVEPNYLSRAQYIPNDFLYDQQWAHKNTQAEQGWDIERGKMDVIIAIVDTGINYSHRDLSGNIWKDAEGNPGYDFVDIINPRDYERKGYFLVAGEDYQIRDHDPSDIHGHGTHAAGIAGAIGGNSWGVAGVAHFCKIMPVRAGFALDLRLGDPSSRVGLLEDEDVAAAIIYAADNGADIINMSFGDYYKARIIKEAIDYANFINVILVAAAGNDGANQRLYPAAYPGVIAVTGINSGNSRLYNYGTWVDIAAPGKSILSTIPGDRYESWSGTSMACPYVSGLAALLKSEHPDYSENQIKYLLYAGAISMPGQGCGVGRVNVYRSLSANSLQPAIAQIQSPQPDAQIAQIADIEGTALAGNFSHYTIETGTGENPATWTAEGVTLANGGTAQIGDGILAAWDLSNMEPAIYTIKLTVYDRSGATQENRVRINYASLKPGWPQQIYTTTDVLGNPIMADLDQDGYPEIISPSHEDNLYAWRRDGTLMQGWPVANGVIFGTPAAADLDNDGKMEVVVAGQSTQGSPTYLLVFNYRGVNIRYLGGTNLHFNIYNPPILVDMDKDGDLEIIKAGSSRLYAWHHTGDIVNGWPVPISSIGTDASLAAGDIDKDGNSEIAVFTDSGFLGVLKSNGAYLAGGWPINTGGAVMYPDYGYRVICPPVLGDIDGDGQLEIIANSKNGLFAVKGNGTVMPGWPKTSETGPDLWLAEGSPALGDLDGDGIPEIILAGHRYNGPSKIWVFKGDGSTFGHWPYELPPESSVARGAVIADIDGDGAQEVIVVCGSPSSFYSAPSMFYVFKGDGTFVQGYPKQWDMNYQTVPVIGNMDLTGDGIDLAIAGKPPYRYPTPFYVYRLKGSSGPRKANWAMFGHDPQHTGCYALPANVISIELEGPSVWNLNGVRMGELRSNTDANGNFLHTVKNTGNVPVNVEIRYGPQIQTAVMPGITQGLDTFITKISGEVLAPDENKKVAVTAPGAASPLSLTYGAPTKVSQGITNMSASYDIRAFAIETQENGK